MYEKFLDFFNKKSNQSIELAIAIVNFIDSIDNNLYCYYEKKGDFISINNIDNHFRLLTIEPYKDIQFIKINIYQANLNNYKNMVDFIYDIFDADINLHYIYFDILENEIPNYIKKLTKENYEDYLIKLTTNKFNL